MRKALNRCLLVAAAILFSGIVPAYGWQCSSPNAVRVQVPNGTTGSGTGDGLGQVVTDGGLTFECEVLPTSDPSTTSNVNKNQNTNTSTATGGSATGQAVNVSGIENSVPINSPTSSSSSTTGASTSNVSGSGNSKANATGGAGGSSSSTGVAGPTVSGISEGDNLSTLSPTSTSTSAGGNATGGAVKNSGNSTATGGSASSGSGSATASGIGNSVNTGTQNSNTATGGAGGAGGKGGTGVGIGGNQSQAQKISNSGNSSNKVTTSTTVSPTNTNTVSPTQTNSQSTTTSANGNGDGSNNASYSSVVNTPRQVATAIAPAQFPSASCFKTFGAAGQAGTFGFSMGGGKIDRDCSARELARSFVGINNMTAAAKVLCSTADAKRAKLTMEDCLAISAPVAPVAQEEEPRERERMEPTIVVPTPSVVVNLPPTTVAAAVIPQAAPADPIVVAAAKVPHRHHVAPCPVVTNDNISKVAPAQQ